MVKAKREKGKNKVHYGIISEKQLWFPLEVAFASGNNNIIVVPNSTGNQLQLEVEWYTWRVFVRTVWLAKYNVTREDLLKLLQQHSNVQLATLHKTIWTIGQDIAPVESLSIELRTLIKAKVLVRLISDLVQNSHKEETA